MSYEEDAHRYQRAIWEMRENQPTGKPLPWWHIANQLGVSIPQLKEIRLAAQRIGVADKDLSTGRVTWRPPDD